MKASVGQALMTGWQAERFARTKDIKSLQHWLEPVKPKSRDAAAGDLRAMFARMAEKQKKENGHGAR